MKRERLFSRPSPTLLKHSFTGNRFFITRDTADKDAEGPPFLLSSVICDYDCISGHARHFPILLSQDKKTVVAGKENESGKKTVTEQHDLFATDSRSANLSPFSRSYLKSLKLPDPDVDTDTAEVIWMHALAVGYAPAYLTENADVIRQDWPRIPLPATKAALLASAKLGGRWRRCSTRKRPFPA